MNHLLGGDFIFQNRRPLTINNTTIIDNTIPERKWGFYVGGFVGGSLTSFDFGAGVLVRYKRVLIGANYGVLSKSVQIPVYYELRRKEKK
jgi:hypothetical protein